MILLQNKRVYADYEVIDSFEAGLVLEGWEVKSLRHKNGNLRGAWVKVGKDAPYIESLKVAPWAYGSGEMDRERPKKLLLTKKELAKAESLFRKAENEYEHTRETLNEVFLENEYEIFVEGHDFFYCYENPSEDTRSGFLVFAIDMYGKVLARGTPLMRKKQYEIRKLADEDRYPGRFKQALGIQLGDCFEIEVTEPVYENEVEFEDAKKRLLDLIESGVIEDPLLEEYVPE